MEMSISCDNLLCDALGRAPSCRVVVYWRNGVINVANKDAKSDWLNGRRKSLKDASKTDSTNVTETTDTSETPPKNFEYSISTSQTSQGKYQRQISNPVWQKHSMTEIVEVSCHKFRKYENRKILKHYKHYVRNEMNDFVMIF